MPLNAHEELIKTKLMIAKMVAAGRYKEAQELTDMAFMTASNEDINLPKMADQFIGMLFILSILLKEEKS